MAGSRSDFCSLLPAFQTGLLPKGKTMCYTAKRSGLIVALAIFSVTAGACGGSTTQPTTTTTTTTSTATLSTDTFTGSIGQNGTAVHTFTVGTSGYTLLAGYTSIAPSSVTALGVGLGSWDSTASTCSLNLTQNDSARSGSTAISGTANAGSYCLRVYDGANIGANVTASYTVQVQHY
jgi:UV excision repair protein RAD23